MKIKTKRLIMIFILFAGTIWNIFCVTNIKDLSPKEKHMASVAVCFMLSWSITLIDCIV